jgi:hypothetical protein
VVLVCSAIVGVSLYFIYIVAAFLFLRHLDAASTNIIEWAIIITQIFRLVGIVAYFGSRPVRIEVLLVALSFETFIVMGLIVTYILTQATFASSLAHTIFSTWIASLFTVLPPYLIFTGLTQMRKNRGVTQVVIPLALEFGFLVFAVSAMLGFGGTFGLGNFFDFLISSAKYDLALGAIPAVITLSILVPSVATYCGLLIYSTIPGGPSTPSSSMMKAGTAVTASGSTPTKVMFVLPMASAAISLAWVFIAVSFFPNTLLSFGAPGIILVILLWAYMRR